MSILDYTDGTHQSGFRGYRVVRKVGDKQMQFYFHSSDYKAAKAKDDELLELQIAAKKRSSAISRREAKPSTFTSDRFAAPSRSGVRGLSFGFQTSSRCVPQRYYPCITVSVVAEDGVKVHTCRCITATTRTLSEAWRQCCRILADAHGLAGVPEHWHEAEPTADQFLALRKFRNKNGHKIPLDVLDYLIETAAL